jgi:large subunit ribosomal protein L33
MGDRLKIVLVCEACGARNYETTKARHMSTGSAKPRLTLKKFCPGCNKHTEHKESK